MNIGRFKYIPERLDDGVCHPRLLALWNLASFGILKNTTFRNWICFRKAVLYCTFYLPLRNMIMYTLYIHSYTDVCRPVIEVSRF
jgi:hypothetical protein